MDDVATSAPRLSVATLLTCLAVFTTTWTAVNVGALNLVDVLIAVAVIAMLMSGRNIKLPLWILMPTVGVLLVMVIDTFFRPERFMPEADIFVLKMLLGTAAPAFLVINLIGREGSVTGYRLLRWFANGMTVNSAVTYAVSLGYYTLPASISAQQTTGERLSGLTFHPNSLAFSLVIALPLYVHLAGAAASRWTAAWWILSLILGVEALALADSRAGYIVGLGGIGLAVAGNIWRRHDGRAWLVVYAGLAGVFFALFVLPYLLTQTRFATESAVQSTAGRDLKNGAAFDTITNNPIFGGGLSASAGVAVPLQVLTIGGLFFGVLYYGFVVGIARPLLRPGPGVLRYYGLLTTGSVLAYGVLSPGITERASYWVPLCFSAMVMFGARPSADEAVEVHQAWSATTRS